jgi:hypothetical protein
MSQSLRFDTLPPEVVGNIIGQVLDQEEPEWVKLVIPHDATYFLICLNEPSPLLRVNNRLREVVIIFGFTLYLKAVDADGNTLPRLVKFNPKKDTLYLDLGLDSLIHPLSLTRLLRAVPLHQIRRIERLAIAYYPAITSQNLAVTAPNFVQDLDNFNSLTRLDIVNQGGFNVDPTASVLDGVVGVAELGNNFVNMGEEDMNAVVDPTLQAWLGQVLAFAARRSFTVNVGSQEG